MHECKTNSFIGKHPPVHNFATVLGIAHDKAYTKNLGFSRYLANKRKIYCLLRNNKFVQQNILDLYIYIYIYIYISYLSLLS